MFVHEKNRKNALDLKKKLDEPYIRKGRVKKSPRVMRMFQVKKKESSCFFYKKKKKKN
jgi:hypothetical protein